MTVIAKEILSQLYESYNQGDNHIQISRDEHLDEWNSIHTGIDYMREKGYIDIEACAATFIQIRLTAKGVDYLERGEQPVTVTPVFNIQNANNAIIGTQQNATINVGYNLEDIQSLIDQAPQSDQDALKEMLELLRKTESSGKPVPRGFLAKYAEPITKVAELANTIGGFVLQWFIRG